MTIMRAALLHREAVASAFERTARYDAAVSLARYAGDSFRAAARLAGEGKKAEAMKIARMAERQLARARKAEELKADRSEDVPADLVEAVA